MLDEERLGYVDVDDRYVRYGPWVCHIDHIESISIESAPINAKEVRGNLALLAFNLVLGPTVLFVVLWVWRSGWPYRVLWVALTLMAAGVPSLAGSFIFDMLGYSPTRNPFKRDWLMTITLKDGYGLKTDWGRKSTLHIKSDDIKVLDWARRSIERVRPELRRPH